MGKAFLKNTADLLQKKHKRKQWQKIMISLSLVVALLTSCLLIHPAITMSRQATCGQEEHTHTEKCYEKKLICNKEEQSISESSETEGEESVEAHTHSDACYENVLICGKQEHTHSEACYPKEEEKKEEVAANTEEEKSEDKDVKSEDQEDKAEEKTEDTEKAEARTLEVDQADYTVEVDCPAEANIPKDAKLKVREIKKDSDEYQDYYEKAMKAVASGDETDISFARFFDISFEVDGKEIEPEAKVEVKITYDDKVEVPEKGKVKSVHFGNKTEVLDVKTNEKNGKMDEVKFDADSFSVYAIVGTETITGDVLTADGETYTVSVTYGADAKIPDGATLNVEEIDPESDTYQKEVENAEALLNKKNEDLHVHQARFFDVKIMDGEKEIQPEADVKVEITAKDITDNGQGLYVTHTHGSKSELIDAKTEEVAEDESKFSFTMDSFSNIGTIKAGETKDMSVGDTATLEGSSSNYNYWEVNRDGIVNISENRNSATIVAVGAGKVKVTHTYYLGLRIRSETFTINVTESSTVTATFNENNGSGTAPSPITVERGEDITFPGSNGLTYNDRFFVGWSTDSDATGIGPAHHRSAVYQPGETVTLTANTTYYAVWAKTNQTSSFYIRLDGRIPQEPCAEGEDNNYNADSYTKGVTINGVLKEAKFYANTTGVNDNLNSTPTTNQLVSMINDSSATLGFSVENKDGKLVVNGITNSTNNANKYNVSVKDELYVIWYVCKQATAGPVLDGYDQSSWHVDGVLLTREKVTLTYSSGDAPAGTVANMPIGTQYNPRTDIRVGIDSATQTVKQPNRNDGYLFRTWKMYTKDEDGNYTVNQGEYDTDSSFTIEEDTLLIAQWVKDTTSLTIIKKDENGTESLAGAEFNLTSVGGNSSETKTSDSNGSAVFSGIELNTLYKLEEINAPEGYAKLINSIYFEEIQSGSDYTVTFYSDENRTTTLSKVDNLNVNITGKALQFTIKNNRQKGKVEFIKTGEGADTTALSGATFTLYSNISCSTDTIIGTATSGSTGKVSFENVPTETYYMKETNAPANYVLDETVYEVVIGVDTSTIKKIENGVATGDSLVEIANNLQRTDIKIKKTDVYGSYITTAVFQLTKLEENGSTYSVITDSKVTGLDGSSSVTINELKDYSVTGLTNGSYRLTETSAPAGYIILDKAIDFTINNGVVTFTDTSQATFDSDTKTFTVKNVAGRELPSTGGSGTLPYTLGGLMLVIASALMYGFRMRRRERRLN